MYILFILQQQLPQQNVNLQLHLLNENHQMELN